MKTQPQHRAAANIARQAAEAHREAADLWRVSVARPHSNLRRQVALDASLDAICGEYDAENAHSWTSFVDTGFDGVELTERHLARAVELDEIVTIHEANLL